MSIPKRPILLLTILFVHLSGLAESGMSGMMGGGGGGGGSSAGVMQLLAVGLIAKLLQDMKGAAKMQGGGHTTKIIPMPVYLGGGGMMGNDWMMGNMGMMGGMGGGMMD
ncbi:hypothetical protein JTE90_005273 [Oedothorax gibbosus]|uniref:Glycine-rich protein n=1 Tax=Oedothorax gibbosus TaxID=931172 RepID=A0AAV6U2G0_9ARAC|nr:hypothetical protein JTE90_005273 [Oedothorax gibbosus]